MEFELSFRPISHQAKAFQNSQLGRSIMAYTKGNFPNLAEADLVIFSVHEYRGHKFNVILIQLRLLDNNYINYLKGRRDLE